MDVRERTERFQEALDWIGTLLGQGSFPEASNATLQDLKELEEVVEKLLEIWGRAETGDEGNVPPEADIPDVRSFQYFAYRAPRA